MSTCLVDSRRDFLWTIGHTWPLYIDQSLPSVLVFKLPLFLLLCIVLPDEARDGRNVALIEFIGVLDRPKKIPSTILQ